MIEQERKARQGKFWCAHVKNAHREGSDLHFAGTTGSRCSHNGIGCFHFSFFDLLQFAPQETALCTAQIIDEKNAIKVVNFMKDDPCQESRCFQFNFLEVRIPEPYPNRLRT